MTVLPRSTRSPLTRVRWALTGLRCFVLSCLPVEVQRVPSDSRGRLRRIGRIWLHAARVGEMEIRRA